MERVWDVRWDALPWLDRDAIPSLIRFEPT
jgi:hypothetical protein